MHNTQESGVRALEGPATAGPAPRVLVVDDDVAMGETLAVGLPHHGYKVVVHTNGNDAFEAVQNEDFDVVVADLNMRGMNGIELCGKIVANRPDMPVVLITAFGSLHTAVEAIRAGAYDFVTKPFDIKTIALSLARAVQHHALEQEVKRLRHQVAASRLSSNLIGASSAINEVKDLIDRLRDSDASVLFTGESGTGKEVAARILHRTSKRARGPFIAINCAGLPENLLESELFGHARGAFTDARSARAGMFVRADGGTLFLDEVGEMRLPLQAKLLRALQERRVRPIGGDTESSFDVRLISTTNTDLEHAIQQGRFREDLYFRLNVVEIHIPPLRARGNDILLLVQHFLESSAKKEGKAIRGISAAAATKLLAYDWPGNVRELQNSVERAVVLTHSGEITVDDLTDKIRNYRPVPLVHGNDPPLELVPLEELERRHVLRVMGAVGGSRSKAAHVLGVDRKTLYRKLELYGYFDRSGAGAKNGRR